MFENLDLLDLLIYVIVLGLVIEAKSLASNTTEESTPQNDRIQFDDFIRNATYKRRYQDRHYEACLQLYVIKSPVGHTVTTYAVALELVVVGAAPPDTISLWLDGHEWPLTNDGKTFPLGGGRIAADYHAVIEESPDETTWHPPMLQRIPYRGDHSV